ncbi:hypothetical protein ACFE04_031493 [Oxalis oulophora]
MSSPYPVLGDRPIDQWKVTELKQELKKRNLAISGLKFDLIKRLDEAIRYESVNDERENEPNEDVKMENEEKKNAAKEDEIKDTNNGFNFEPQTVVVEKGPEEVQITSDEAARNVVDHASDKSAKVDDANLQLGINDNPSTLGQDKGRDDEEMRDTNAVCIEDELTSKVSENDVALESETQEVNSNLKSQLESDDSKPQLENKAAHKDTKLASSASNEQVPEVSSNLGIKVKSDSICTDSVSINEKIELKDNIIADNVKIELDVVIKPEMVSNVGGESHPMDVEEPLEYAEEKDDKITEEKLNLDRSSGDDSMEDDVLESKTTDEVANTNKIENKLPPVNEEIRVGDVVTPFENKSPPPTLGTEKRKNLNDEEGAGTVKRQRRWNSESVKIPEQQSSNITVSTTTTPKEPIQSPPAFKRNYSRSDSTASVEEPKERIVPPSQKPATNCLKIDRFLRPFTLKAVQEMLGKTGTVTSFWMDQIKTHCYVSYSSVEEALETRNAVYNLKWPPNGGKLLVAEFVDPEEVKMKTTPAASRTPVNMGPPTPAVNVGPPLKQPEALTPRQQLPPPPPPPLVRERLAAPPPPEKAIVTLDDLFRKTKAVPRIYYLALSEEQVAARRSSNNARQ